MAKNDVISVENNITKKDFRKVFWRSFTLLGSFNYEKMEGLAYLYCIEHILKKIYKDDEEGLKQAMLRESAAFNMTIAPAPFVMGISIAMEESVKRDPNFDPASINAIKVSLMGPLSGIGDTFFWGIFRILACSLSIGFAKAGNPIAPFILLILFNIPTFLTRYYGLKIGYTSGNQLLIDLEKSGKMQLFTYCAGILGVAAIGCMIASWVTVSCPLEFTISGNKIVIQEYLDQIMPKLLPLAATLGIYSAIKKEYQNHKDYFSNRSDWICIRCIWHYCPIGGYYGYSRSTCGRSFDSWPSLWLLDSTV
ncbi:PTS system mannose/fructose/sorbose family transporter subunit IID [Holdemanella biformis]|uniref:PTS system mannose/fructose/sorbose family IID component n=1 Tax=Holdemanella biformis DSM 3989 TaxID=518637 RepID=B7C8C5_9FIRM|nr:PTS system mannose/fructose/sorbose family transporter subunit IID [Holdemanella biformis]EEC91009.1 PTS system mannose/fructose/sorbose family IID component [Holdemanella biformis DSM 3989]